MRSVKSINDLKKLALAKGAVAAFGNTRFNSSMEKVGKPSVNHTPTKSPKAKS